MHTVLMSNIKKLLLFFLFCTRLYANTIPIAEEINKFWENQAEEIFWFKKWEEVSEWNPPYSKWFVKGKINACYNCLDRHMSTETRKKNALIWEGENGENQTITYEELFLKVNSFSNTLKSLGVSKGDRVIIYLPMIPEAVIAMLSCARIGAIHVIVFAGFSAEALKDRIQDAEAKIVITADGTYRKGKIIPLKNYADEALEQCPTVEKMLLIKHTNQFVNLKVGRDFWFTEDISYCFPEHMDSEDPLFILYTSGTTGKPKGIIHSTGGYTVAATTTAKSVFELKDQDIYWCTADVGWITGHTYIVYGPLANGATVFIYEGAPDFPQRDRWWQLIEKYKVTILYTSPTAIRTFMKWGEEWIKYKDLSSLRILGSVGEPINPEAWNWFHKYIGNSNCSIVDTWWQTETGCIIISPIPGQTKTKPGSATFALPGFDVKVVDEIGIPTTNGYLVLASPWPSMLKGIYKDNKKYEETYWKKWNGKYYFTGDGAKIDEDGYIWLQGRIDDVMNVSGHRLSTIEIENALIDCKFIAESAVIGITHEIKGQAIVAFVTVKVGVTVDASLEDLIKQHVVKKIGAIARPEKVIFISELPKTRSGKIMRRLLRDIAEGKLLGDLSTLADSDVVKDIKEKYGEEEN